MNPQKTVLKKKVTKIFLAAVVGLIIWNSAATAQESLGSLMEQSGSEWIVGKWVGESPDGQKYAIEYKWELKPHVLSVHFKGFDFEYHGIIFFNASEEQVIQIGVDSRGGNGKGIWEAEYGKAIMKSEHAGEYGEVSRTGFVYSKVDANAMKCELYALDEYGTLGDEPEMTLEYKRQKQPTPKKIKKVESTKLTLRINCGAAEPYTDKAGNIWLADQGTEPGGKWGAVDGLTVDRGDLGITGTDAPKIYETERYSMEGYKFTVPNDKYTVRLHFAETYDGITAEGERVFSVTINDQTILKDFDPFKEAGGYQKPAVKTIEDVTVTNGQLVIGFTLNIQNPEINGIEILSE